MSPIFRNCHTLLFPDYCNCTMSLLLVFVQAVRFYYPRYAMLALVLVIATCLSVRLSACLSVRHAPVLCQNEES